MSWQNIETAEDKAAKLAEQERQAFKANRDQSLASMTYKFADGSEIQNRPIDAPQLQTAISLGVDRDWLMADNTKRIVTIAELNDALNDGVLKASIIWQEYIDAIDSI